MKAVRAFLNADALQWVVTNIGWSISWAAYSKHAPDVVRLQVGKVLQDLGFGHVGGQQVRHIFDANAHPPNTRTSTTLVGVELRSAYFIALGYGIFHGYSQAGRSARRRGQ